jgi:hypothetical protein
MNGTFRGFVTRPRYARDKKMEAQFDINDPRCDPDTFRETHGAPLLACPFCGAEGVLRPWHPKGHADKLWRAECSSFDCGALIGPYPDPDFAREQWNQRYANNDLSGTR